MPPRDAAVLVMRLGLGAMFVWTGAVKIVDPGAFAVIVENYRVLPPAWVPLVAVLLPWVETVCGMALLLGVFLRGGALTICCLMTIFTLLHVFNYMRGLDVACGCFSVSTAVRTGAVRLLLRDLPILFGACWLLYRLGAPDGKKNDKRRRGVRGPVVSTRSDAGPKTE